MANPMEFAFSSLLSSYQDKTLQVWELYKYLPQDPHSNVCLSTSTSSDYQMYTLYISNMDNINLHSDGTSPFLQINYA